MLFFRMSYLLSTSFCIFPERSLQILIPLSFLFLSKMYLSLLFRIILIIQHFIAELLACEIKSAVTYHIVTMIVSAWSLYTVHLSTKYILCQKAVMEHCPSVMLSFVHLSLILGAQVSAHQI